MSQSQSPEKKVTSTPEITKQESIKKLGELIKGIRFAMMTTQDPDGHLRSRPMATQDVEFDGRVWFFTDIHSGKVFSMKADSQVNLSYMSPEQNRYVSVSGTAVVNKDPAKIKELWTPAMLAWFPDGPDSPELCLLCIEVEAAEYWDTPSSKLVQLIGFTKAVLTGKRYEPGPDEHQKTENLNRH
jgi:general stress protein 26